jgi:hypothetical protein
VAGVVVLFVWWERFEVENESFNNYLRFYLKNLHGYSKNRAIFDKKGSVFEKKKISKQGQLAGYFKANRLF